MQSYSIFYNFKIFYPVWKESVDLIPYPLKKKPPTLGPAAYMHLLSKNAFGMAFGVPGHYRINMRSPCFCSFLVSPQTSISASSRHT